MEFGFIQEEELIRKDTPLIPRCGKCGLYKSCNSPKMKVVGEGKKKILVVGEAPGEKEDEQGRPFVGVTGDFLRSILSRMNVPLSLEEDCWRTNAIICRPKDNRTPTSKEIEYCRPNIIKAIEELQPVTILLLGSSAVHSIIGWLRGEDPGGISRWIGWKIPSQRLNAWVCPTWHPSYIMRMQREVPWSSDIIKRMWEKHLQEAVELDYRPWKIVPDYKSQVDIELSPIMAARKIIKFLDGKKSIAFDYETDRLKPDHSESRIVSCAISDGVSTVAYPWHGKAIRATRVLIQSDLPKIASNAKFEERWTLKEFGHGVNNWMWDTMLSAHVLDSRPDITSIKFQAFVMLGQEPWERGTKKYFESGGTNHRNKIHQMDLNKLLLYNGMDALLEWKVAQIQMKEMDPC